ncbi:MAG: succinate dehydrogenase/fumarate reductase transmembrane subunit [Anaerolineaceae bacterium]
MHDGFDVKSRMGESAGAWFFKVASGGLIILVLFIHLVINHLIVEGGLLKYADVVKYYQTWIVPFMEVFFLVFVVSHSLIGLRSVLLDLHPSNQVLRWLNRGLVVIGCAAIIYGTWLVIVIVGRG